MARYINPADDVKKIGKSLVGGNLLLLKADAGHDCVVVGVYDRGMHRVALVIDDRSYSDMENQYSQGLFISRQFYAVPCAAIDEMGNIKANA